MDLLQGHVTAQMDYSENWAIKYNEEVSAAYFSKDQVTVHPIVVHYKDSDAVQTKTFIAVSKNPHAAPTVFSIMKALVNKIRNDLPTTTHLHYITDSLNLQYRNISILSIISLHKVNFNLEASWTYFESGHGKGPCDGARATSKRAADEAVLRGNSIRSAEEYFKW